MTELTPSERKQQSLERPLFVRCEVCDAEGRIYTGLYEDERDHGECPACHGTCMMEVPSEPVILEDLP